MTTPRAHRARLARLSVLLMAAALFVPGPGCAQPQYYKVTDPKTNNVYYTQKLRRPMDNKTVTFRDVRTNKTVTLDKVQLDAMDRPEYQASTDGAANP
jgi:hypothetical protein